MLLSDAIKRPVATSTIIFAMLVIGAFSYMKLNVDFLPRIDFPYVTVTTVYPGAGPKEIETLVTQVIEDAVSEVDGVKHIRSTSMENISQVFIEFELGTDVNFASIDVREKVDGVKGDLPDDAETPLILKYDVNAKPVMNLAVVGSRPLNELYDLTDKIIKDQLTKISGVASVEIIGGKRREIQILVDQDKMVAHNITISDVIRALKESNLDLPSGHITERYYEYSVRLKGEFSSVKQMEEIELRIPSEDKLKTIPITEIAEIKDSFEEQRQLAYYNGQECVGITLKKRADANTVRVVEQVGKQLDYINKMIPDDVRLKVINDDSAFIRHSVSDVSQNMYFGIILTSILLYLFLHNIKATFIAAISMPVSVVATYTLVYFAGFTLNIMSLMALAISIGILVTNCILVIENIERYMSLGHDPKDASQRGASEIALAVVASTLTNVVVFLPIAFMSGLVGQFFKEFGLTVTFATFVSLFVSFTLTPVLTSKLFKKKTENNIEKKGILNWFSQKWDRFYDWLAEIYIAVLKRVLVYKWSAILISILLFLGSMKLASYLGSEMVTEPDRGEITVSVEMPPGSSIGVTQKTLSRVEKIIEEKFQNIVTGTYTKIGKVEGLFGKSSQGVHLGEILVLVKDKNERKETANEIMDNIRNALSNIPSATIIVQQPTAIGGSEAPIQIEISGYDLKTLYEISEDIRKKTEQTKGTASIDTTWRSGKPELSISPIRQRLHDYGLNVAQVAYGLRANLEGIVPCVYRVGSKEYDIRVKLTEPDRTNIEQVRSFYVPLRGGVTIPLYNLAKVTEIEGPTQIIRKNKQRVVIISSNNIGRSIGEIWQELKAYTDNMNMPPGYSVFYGGMIERMQESFTDIFMAFIMAIILTYLVLAALLESYIQPFTIMLTLPLALIGVFLSLFITKNTISIFSMMAVVMLVGIVVNNGILLIDYIVVLRNEGKTRLEAIFEACFTRLKPIIMTTLASIIGMIPLALGTGWGSEMRSPMGIVSIGGLIVSGMLTLFIIPIVYTLFDSLKEALFPVK